MQSFTPWLRPTILGPLLTLYGLTTVGSVLLGIEALSGGRLDSWLIAMLWSSFFGCSLAVLLIGADVLLLRLKWRQLPTGGRAWLSSCLAPLGVFVIWSLPIVPPPESTLGLAAFIVLPMVAAAFLSRVIFGARI